MACGQKKQNNTQTGVHLTERTCSPYNPIIKQIVDDCLGLPIYPVTSIDAVIDEDGNTLRKLLEDLILQINDGDSSYEEITNKITQIEIAIEGLTADKERLKALLWAISALTTMGNATENNIWEVIDSKPYIVHVIEQIRDEVDGLGDDFSALDGVISDLKDLLLAVANFNTGAYTYDGLEHYEDDNKIKIIKEILDIKAILGDGSGEGTLMSRIEALEGHVKDLLSRVDALEAASATHAHLDPNVLAQMPNVSISEKNKNHYRTLKISEYPPTSAEFLRSKQDVAALKGGHVYYFGFLPPVSYNKPNPYPFGHTEDYGYPIFIKNGNGQFQSLTAHGQQLKMGDNYLSGADFVQETEIIKMFHSPAKLKVDADNLPEGAQYSDIYYSYNGHYYLVGDFNFNVNTQEPDNEVSIGDINRLIEDYLNGTPQISVSTPYSNSIDCGYLIYKDDELGVIAYPCIKGKIYADSLTGLLYRYESNRMLPVSEVVIKGDGAVDVSQEIKYAISEIDEDEETVNYGPYTEYTISVDSVSVPSYIGGSGIDVEENVSQSGTTYTINIAPNAVPVYIGGNGTEVIQYAEQTAVAGAQYAINVVAGSNDGTIDVNVEDGAIDLSSKQIIQAKYVVEGNSTSEYSFANVQIGEYYIADQPIYILPTFSESPSDFNDPNSDIRFENNKILKRFNIVDAQGAIDVLLEVKQMQGKLIDTQRDLCLLKQYVEQTQQNYETTSQQYTDLQTIIDKVDDVLGGTSITSSYSEVSQWANYMNEAIPSMIQTQIAGNVSNNKYTFYYIYNPNNLNAEINMATELDNDVLLKTVPARWYPWETDNFEDVSAETIQSIIDIALEWGPDTEWLQYNPRPANLGINLYKKIGENDVMQIMSLDADAEGQDIIKIDLDKFIIKAKHKPSVDRDASSQRDWYYFDENNKLKSREKLSLEYLNTQNDRNLVLWNDNTPTKVPLNYSLGVEQNTNGSAVALKLNNEKISEISMSSIVNELDLSLTVDSGNLVLKSGDVVISQISLSDITNVEENSTNG